MYTEYDSLNRSKPFFYAVKHVYCCKSICMDMFIEKVRQISSSPYFILQFINK